MRCGWQQVCCRFCWADWLTDVAGCLSSCAGDFLSAIKRDFGDFEKMQERMTAKTVAIQGSGWGWLVSAVVSQLVCALRSLESSPPAVLFRIQGFNPENGRLEIATCKDQDPVLSTTGQRRRRGWGGGVGRAGEGKCTSIKLTRGDCQPCRTHSAAGH